MTGYTSRTALASKAGFSPLYRMETGRITLLSRGEWQVPDQYTGDHEAAVSFGRTYPHRPKVPLPSDRVDGEDAGENI